MIAHQIRWTKKLVTSISLLVNNNNFLQLIFSYVCYSISEIQRNLVQDGFLLLYYIIKY